MKLTRETVLRLWFDPVFNMVSQQVAIMLVFHETFCRLFPPWSTEVWDTFAVNFNVKPWINLDIWLASYVPHRFHFTATFRHSISDLTKINGTLAIEELPILVKACEEARLRDIQNDFPRQGIYL